MLTRLLWRLFCLENRQLCVVQDFEALISALIFLNCVSMAAYAPQQPAGSDRNRILGNIETVVNVAFTVEILLKLGAAPTVAAYFRSKWNLFDFLLVAAGYTTFLPFAESTSSFKVCPGITTWYSSNHCVCPKHCVGQSCLCGYSALQHPWM